MDATRVEKARSLGRLVLGVGIPIAVLAVGFLLTRSLADWQYESLVGLATAETDVQALTDVQDGMAGTFVLLFVYGIAMFVSTAVAMTLARSRLLGVVIGVAGVAAYWVLIAKHTGRIDAIPYLEATEVGGPVTSMLRAGIVAPIACAMGGNLAGAYLASEAIGRDRERRRAHVGVAGEQQNPEGVLACGGQIDEGARKPGVYRGERKAVPCRACGATNAPGNASCIRCGAVLEWRDG